MLPIIDTHQHLWDLSRFQLAWLKEGSPIAHNHLMSDYLAQTEGMNVVGTLYMEVDVIPEQQMQEVDYVLDLCRQPGYPMRGAIISGRPASDGFEPYVRAVTAKADGYVKGVRQVLHGDAPTGFCLQPSFLKGMNLLSKLDLSFDICIRPEELADAAKLAQSCPETRFILDHCGNADVRSPDLSLWRKGIDLVASQPNVACKISGIIVTVKPDEWSTSDLAPIVDHCAAAFGPDRIVFGGDWPVCTLGAPLREWMTSLREIIVDWPEENQRKLLHDNGLKSYHLER